MYLVINLFIIEFITIISFLTPSKVLYKTSINVNNLEFEVV